MSDTLEVFLADKDIDAISADKLMNFFKYTAFYLVACSEVSIEMENSKTFDFPLAERYSAQKPVDAITSYAGEDAFERVTVGSSASASTIGDRIHKIEGIDED